MYTVSEINGIKTYNLSAGKNFPQFLEEAFKTHKSLKTNSAYRNRIELIQDFDFPISSLHVAFTPDQQQIVASGIYPPSIKIFETSELSQKCLRGMDSEIATMKILSENYSKIAFGCLDRNIEFHAQYGKHFKTRIPKIPRQISYNPFTCDLLIGATGSEIFRLNLEEGKFLAPFLSSSPSTSSLEFIQPLNLLLSGGDGGLVEAWDYREREKAKTFVNKDLGDVTSLAVESNGIAYAVGDSLGQLRLFDLRYSGAILSIKSRNRLPITKALFHSQSRKILFCDSIGIRMVEKDTGVHFTTIESKYKVNSFDVAKDSGLIIVGNETSRIGTYFVPALGIAPSWCSYLENITEELENENSDTIFDEFKFVSANDLAALNATHLLETNMVKPYLNGFLIHAKLHQKLAAVSDPFAYKRYKEEIVAKKLKDQSQTPISKAKSNKKVNKEYLEEVKKRRKGKEEVEKLISDSRFSKMFESEDYKVDVKADSYKYRKREVDEQEEWPQSEEDGDQQIEEEKPIVLESFQSKLKKKRISKK